MQNTPSGLRWLWLSALAIAVDLASKYWVVTHFSYGESYPLLPFFDFTYARNTGAAFSFMANSPLSLYFFPLLALLVSIGLVVALAKQPASQRLSNISYSLLIGGALGNAIDRSYNGYVIDFLHVFYQHWHYPIFNLADVFISVGVGLMLLELFFDRKKSNA